MRVIVWGINYAPELTGIAVYNQMLCEYLQTAGMARGAVRSSQRDDPTIPVGTARRAVRTSQHDVPTNVKMVTTFAYYPAWKKAAADRGRLFRTDTIAGVKVYRCWHYVPQKVSALKRIFHEASFVVTSFLRLLVLPTPEVYIVVSPPLLLGFAAWLLTRFRRAPFIFHVQDLQPDAALTLGMLKPGAFTRMLYGLEKIAYRQAAAVSGISHGMLDAFSRKGVPKERQIYFPNPVQLPDTATLPPAGAFRARNGFAPDDFLAVYSGNLGVKQGLTILIEAARELQKNPAARIKIVICGDGAVRPQIEAAIQREKLSNLFLFPLQPAEHYLEMLTDADVCLITQQAGSGAAFFPSKLLATLAYARPVVSVADEQSELTRAIREGQFGESVLPGDAVGLAGKLLTLASDKSRLRDYGLAGRRYVEQFEADKVLPQFIKNVERRRRVR
jgi:colanic acid biosynthesis glycosyl transferase WcaI